LGRSGRRAWGVLLLVALLALGLVAIPAGAERAQSGNLIVSLDGGVTPVKLPRDREAPVSVRLVGGVTTADDSPLPRVREIKFALAYRGGLFTKGLAVCPRAQLRGADSTQSMERCGAALVGRGALQARIFLPSQEPFNVRASLLAFNGRTKEGKTAIWVHAYVPNPPVAFVLPFHIRHQPGPFSTVLETVVPRDVGPWPRFAHFQITVGRQFTYKGERHSYLSASCPLPADFTAGFLSFAKATFSFDDAPDLTTESVRSCRARPDARPKPPKPQR
jgi:hypothetical protein